MLDDSTNSLFTDPCDSKSGKGLGDAEAADFKRSLSPLVDEPSNATRAAPREAPLQLALSLSRSATGVGIAFRKLLAGSARRRPPRRGTVSIPWTRGMLFVAPVLVGLSTRSQHARPTCWSSITIQVCRESSQSLSSYVRALRHFGRWEMGMGDGRRGGMQKKNRKVRASLLLIIAKVFERTVC